MHVNSLSQICTHLPVYTLAADGHWPSVNHSSKWVGYWRRLTKPVFTRWVDLTPCDRSARSNNALVGQVARAGGRPIGAKKQLRRIAGLSVASLITLSQLQGCAASGPTFSGFQSPSTESAQIVFYRPDLFRAGAQPVAISIDQKEVGVLRNGGWFSVNVKPMEQAVTLKGSFTLLSRETRLMVKPQSGESIALRVVPGAITSIAPLASGPVVNFGPWTIQQVSLETAKSELSFLKESK